MTSIFKALIWSATLHAECNTICETAEHESNMSYETFLWVFMNEEPRSLITNVHFLAANNAYIRKAVTLSLRDAIITTLSSPGAFQGHVPDAVQPGLPGHTMYATQNSQRRQSLLSFASSVVQRRDKNFSSVVRAFFSGAAAHASDATWRQPDLWKTCGV